MAEVLEADAEADIGPQLFRPPPHQPFGPVLVDGDAPARADVVGEPRVLMFVQYCVDTAQGLGPHHGELGVIGEGVTGAHQLGLQAHLAVHLDEPRRQTAHSRVPQHILMAFHHCALDTVPGQEQRRRQSDETAADDQDLHHASSVRQTVSDILSPNRVRHRTWPFASFTVRSSDQPVNRNSSSPT